MVRIRLRRMGAKRQPGYRIVVADIESPRDGRFIEVIGEYNPRTDPPTVKINEERARHWLSVGAQPSEPVARLFKKAGITAAAPVAVPAGAPATEPSAEPAAAPAPAEPDATPTGDGQA